MAWARAHRAPLSLLLQPKGFWFKDYFFGIFGSFLKIFSFFSSSFFFFSFFPFFMFVFLAGVESKRVREG